MSRFNLRISCLLMSALSSCSMAERLSRLTTKKQLRPKLRRSLSGPALHRGPMLSQLHRTVEAELRPCGERLEPRSSRREIKLSRRGREKKSAC